MAKNHDRTLSEKCTKLSDLILSGRSTEEFEKEIAPSLAGDSADRRFAAFYAVCNTKKAAKVFPGTGETFKEALEAAKSAAVAGANKYDIEPRWVKLEVVISSEEMPVQEAVDTMFSSYNQFFRRGISLDVSFSHAYTEGEINGFRLIDYKNKIFDLRKFNEYTMERDDDVILKNPDTLYIFTCAGAFIDDRDNVFKLYSTGYNTGRRDTGEITSKDIRSAIFGGIRFLLSQQHPDGTFDYGYYPLSHKLLSSYNIMRHTSVLWSLLCSAQIEKNPEVYKATVSAIKYTLSQIREFDDGCAYLIEEKANEIKLGANGVAIIALTQFMKIYETDEYSELCVRLGRGILKMMKDDGSFVHVLEADTRELKAEVRTVYYDGEATFALCRLHSLTGSKLWLEAARRSVDHFIAADYTIYKDHWVAYALNELTMYDQDERYLEFALRNVQVNLDPIYKRPTTYHTFLEMLMAGYETYARIIEMGIDVPYLKKLDVKKFAETILYRAQHMLTGYGYPEYVMYFRKPSYFKGCFFIRHDSFRTRIDDVQHNCGAYIALYRHFDEIIKLREG